MGEVLGKLFIEPEVLPQDDYGLFQVLFLGAVYGYILFNASNMISEGSELLLLTSAKDLVGSVVLPILGAVPDGAIILFSGATQESLAVGVGALAGSTIMLLTIPWFLAIVAGRVNVKNGKPVRPKVSEGSFSSQMFTTGAFCNKSIARGGWFMFTTMIAYFVIQIPSLRFGCVVENCGCAPGDVACLQKIALEESTWALTGLVMSLFLFFVYLYDQLAGGGGVEVQETKDRIRNDIAEKAMNNGLMSIEYLHKTASQADVKRVLLRYFHHYDKDRSNDIDADELSLLVNDLHEGVGLVKCIKEADHDQNGRITWTEFESGVNTYLEQQKHRSPTMSSAASPSRKYDEEDSEDSGEDEMPDDLKDMSSEQQQAAIWKRACSMMAVGTAMVLIFSDPMVSVLSNTGARIGVSPFYISFIMAPLASNASELLAAYNYALKKTENTFTISLSTLIGAACMNNTFCLAIFLYLIYSKTLLWEFTAETSAIVVIELVMFLFSQQTFHPSWQAPVVLLLFPLSLALVVGLEAIGLD
eukprot:TRINITY_DN2377_c1_g1_i2.p1 TRINITY_DN2377_c1_g1~~TRINITY_DN2377_c1_g1_i2.p1  ORF type:complete len:530 (+),score=104.27 TRINITY_DN2377_c1_g1_i2:59-1648(+)